MQGFGSIEEHGLHVSRLRRGRLGGHIAFHDGHVVDFHNIKILAVVVTEGDVDALALKIVGNGQDAVETLAVSCFHLNPSPSASTVVHWDSNSSLSSNPSSYMM